MTESEWVPDPFELLSQQVQRDDPDYLKLWLEFTRTALETVKRDAHARDDIDDDQRSLLVMRLTSVFLLRALKVFPELRNSLGALELMRAELTRVSEGHRSPILDAQRSRGRPKGRTTWHIGTAIVGAGVEGLVRCGVQLDAAAHFVLRTTVHAGALPWGGGSISLSTIKEWHAKGVCREFPDGPVAGAYGGALAYLAQAGSGDVRRTRVLVTRLVAGVFRKPDLTPSESD